MSENKTAPAAVKLTKRNKAAKAAVKAAEMKAQTQKSYIKDKFLWLLAFIVIAAAIGGNFYYTQHVVIDESTMGRLLRVIIVIAALALGLVITLFTQKGRQLLSFGRESYVELRKVVWPTRQEAVQTTFIVFVAVCVVSLFLYLCDIVFLQIVRAITL